MNKRRLLLFSVFALLHITTSERNFIDGSYEFCNHSSSYLSSESCFIESKLHRVHPLITRDPESTQLTRQGEEYPTIFGRYRTRILATPSKEFVGRRNFRDRITVYRPLSNVIHRRKLVSSSLRYNNQINEINTNRFKYRRTSRFAYNDRDRKKRDSLERNTQRYASREILRKYGIYERYTERNVLPQKLVLDRNVYHQDNSQNIRNIRPERESTINYFDTRRFSRLITYQNLDNELSQKALRKIITSRNKASQDRTKYNNRISNDISRRILIRDVDYLKIMTDNRERSSARVYNREVNERSRDTRNIKLELREPTRDYIRSKRDVVARIQNDALNIDQLDVNREREKSPNRRRSSSGLMHIITRDIPTASNIDFDRKDDKHNVRYNRQVKDKLISNDNKNKHINGNPERITFDETKERVNIFRLRNNNANRYFKDTVMRNIPKNRLFSIRRSFVERSPKRDNERRTQIRDQIRQPRSIIQRDIDNELNRILRRSRLSFSLGSDKNGKDETRRKSRVLRFFNDNIKSEQRQVHKRDQNDDKTRDINTIRRSLEKSQSSRENQNRIMTERRRTNMQVITSRQILRNVRTSTEDVNNYQKSRNVRYEERSTNNRLITRKAEEERRKTKQSQQDRSINTRRIDTTNEKRYSVVEFFGSNVSRPQNINYGSYIFEMKWQYLFYALQFVYLLGVIMHIPKNNRENKQKNRIVAWLTPAEHLKTY